MSELTEAILADMGIIPLKSLSNGSGENRTGAVQKKRFVEFDDDEVDMNVDDAVYSRNKSENVLTMQEND